MKRTFRLLLFAPVLTERFTGVLVTEGWLLLEASLK